MQGKSYRTWAFRLLLMFVFMFQKGALANTQQVIMPHFALESRATLAPAVVSFSMFGRFNADSSNVVLVCTWFTGKSPDVGRLWTVETGYLDTSRYAIVVIDALGNGLSASPSNYKTADFPEITIADMVRMQHEVLTGYLGIKKLYAVAGISMGGMQAWQWVALYPGFMQKMVAISATPRQTAYDLLFWNTTLNLLQLSLNRPPAVKDSLLKAVAMVQELHLYTPAYRNAETKVEAAANWIQTDINYAANADPRNWICQVRAMMKHDVFRYRSAEKWASNATCEMLLIVPQNDLMVNPAASLAKADAVGAKVIVLRDDCGHQSSVLCGKEQIKMVIHEFL